MAKKLDPRRKALKALAKDIAQATPFDDPFHGMGDFVPRDTRPNAIARVIAKLEGMKITKPKPKDAKPKVVKRAPKKKKTPPPPKKGKSVAKANQILIQSPYDKYPQWMPLVPEISELLAEGWVIVEGGDVPVEEAYSFLNFTPEGEGA